MARFKLLTCNKLKKTNKKKAGTLALLWSGSYASMEVIELIMYRVLLITSLAAVDEFYHTCLPGSCKRAFHVEAAFQTVCGSPCAVAGGYTSSFRSIAVVFHDGTCRTQFLNSPWVSVAV